MGQGGTVALVSENTCERPEVVGNKKTPGEDCSSPGLVNLLENLARNAQRLTS